MTIFTFEKLFTAYKACLKHKKNTVNALKFEMNRERNLIKLLNELKTGKYKISRHICFVITDPAPREIFAADFRDRVVHHLLYNEIRQLFENDFIENSYANRRFKGTHMAVKKMKYYLSRGGIDGRRLYYLKMDIKGFFRNIDKRILWKIVEEKINQSDRELWWKREILWLNEKIIFHDPASNYIFKGHEGLKHLIPKEKSLILGSRMTGLPIGNLTSQFYANIYLNKLDYFISNELGFDRYIRYVDDFVILSEDKEVLSDVVNTTSDFLTKNLNLELCVQKTKLKTADTGIDFLGYFIKPTHTLVRRKVVKRFKKKIFKLSHLQFNDLHHDLTVSVFSSYFGHFSHACSYNLRKRFCLYSNNQIC